MDANSGEEDDGPKDDFLERYLTSVTTTRAGSERATTPPVLKEWDGARDREPEMDTTRRLAEGLASHLLLTSPDVAAAYEFIWVCFRYTVAVLATPDWVSCCDP